MFSKVKKLVCGVCAAALMAAFSVSAFADYTYQIVGDGLCDEIKSDYQDINGTEGTFETEFGDSTQEKYLSLRFKLFNEYLDTEFWNNDDITVSVDVKLETEGADVIGCLPGFNSNWGWINPSDYTPLKYGEWVTVSEKASHYYEEFAKSGPAYILFQVRTNWGAPAQGNVRMSVRNFRITDGTGTVVTTPDDTSTSDSESEPIAEGSTDISASSEASDTGEAVVGPDQSTPAATTAQTIRTAATAATTAAISYNDLYTEPESPMIMVIIIVGVVVLVSAAAVIGYLIYRKKKYY